MAPASYQTFYPDNVQTEAGSDGWSQAPVPGWGQNLNWVGRRRIAVNGLGGPTAISGLGAIEMGRSYGPVYVGTGADAEPDPTRNMKIALGLVAAYFVVAYISSHSKA